MQIRDYALERCRTHQHELRSAGPSLDHAERHVFERVSVAFEHQLLTKALRHGRGQIDLAQLKGELSLQEWRAEILRAGQEVATRESLNREREMIARVNCGVGQFERLVRDCHVELSDKLRPEQKKAVEFVLDSHDLAVNLRGAAGVGKTVTLQEIYKGLQQSGREVLAVAPTMSAVEELQRVGLRDAVTVERLLQNRSGQHELRGTVIIVDEAGMVSGRQMSELLKIAEEHSARLVFSGDTKQIRSVEACDALRVLEKESGLKGISLTGVQRQTSEAYRAAIEELRRDPQRGFDRLEAIGAIREVSWLARAQAVEQAYFDARSEQSANGQPRSVLVVAATNEEIREITSAIRSELTCRGELLNVIRFERHVPMNWTRAQKSDIGHYREGHVLKFHRAVGGIDRGESLHVVRVDADRVIAKNLHGDERAISPKQGGCLSVCERLDIQVATGDTLLLMSNRRDSGFSATNGELVTVSRIDEQNRIHLRDGRVLPTAYKEFTHGYAITAHRSQGKSVDSVVISGDGMRKEQFYVAASRGRESVTVVTSDREVLRETIAHSDIRQSASELDLKARSPEHQRGLRETCLSRSDVCEKEQAMSESINQSPGDHSIDESVRMKERNQGISEPAHQQASELCHSIGMSH